jgi:hypothetical protein
VTLGQIFLRVNRFPTVSIIPPVLHTHSFVAAPALNLPDHVTVQLNKTLKMSHNSTTSLCSLISNCCYTWRFVNTVHECLSVERTAQCSNFLRLWILLFQSFVKWKLVITDSNLPIPWQQSAQSFGSEAQFCNPFSSKIYGSLYLNNIIKCLVTSLILQIFKEFADSVKEGNLLNNCRRCKEKGKHVALI